MGIRVTISQADLKKMTTHLVKNVHYAATVTLTKVAKELQKEVIQDLKSTYTIRSRWVVGSIKYTSADKKDEIPTAQVGTIQPFMESHELGGKRLQKKGTDLLGIPLYARHDRGMITAPSTWPSAILGRGGYRGPQGPSGGLNRRPAKGPDRERLPAGARGPSAPIRKKRKEWLKYFIAEIRGKPFVVQRMGKKGPLRFWWTLRPTVIQRPDWHFGKRFVPRAEVLIAEKIKPTLDEALRH